MSLLLIILFVAWTIVACINYQSADKCCDLAQSVNFLWWINHDTKAVEKIYWYYNPFNPKTYFGFRALFICFPIPMETPAARILRS